MMAPATCALFRMELFQRVGLLDTAFESYLEDVDFGLRCAMAGLPGVYVPGAVAYHWGSASLGAWSARVVRLIARNQIYLVHKHYPFQRYWWPILVGQLLWGLVALRHGAGWAFLKGKVDGMQERRSRARDGHPGLEKILQMSEAQIREAQRRTGFDWYWKVYFLLTSREAE